MVFVLNLISGCDRMILLTDPSKMQLTAAIFINLKLFRYDSKWMPTADLSLKHELLVLYRNLDYGIQLIQEVERLYPVTQYSFQELVVKNFPSRQHNLVYK